MRPAGRLALGVLALAAGSIAALAQSAVISARSGLIHYVEGQVYLGDQLVETKFGVFPEVKENQQLKTEEGRAEVLLTPGVFLRLGENSSFRMITNRLIDTRLEFQIGREGKPAAQNRGRTRGGAADSRRFPAPRREQLFPHDYHPPDRYAPGIPDRKSVV